MRRMDAALARVNATLERTQETLARSRARIRPGHHEAIAPPVPGEREKPD
jgi:hypothetical protein